MARDVWAGPPSGQSVALHHGRTRERLPNKINSNRPKLGKRKCEIINKLYMKQQLKTDTVSLATKI